MITREVHAVVPHEEYRLEPPLWSGVRSRLLLVAAIAWAASLVGLALDKTRFFQSYLFAFTCCTMIPLGAWFFVQVQYLTGSAWSVTVRRLMETLMSIAPVGLLLFVPVLFGLGDLYEWARPEAQKDPLLQLKAGWLNPAWFGIRAFLYFALWALWTQKLYRNSLAQDQTGSLENMHTASHWSAPGLLVSMLSVSLASFDWIMSLNPHWYSTIFGIYCYVGGAWSMFAVLTLLCLFLRAEGLLRREINVEHYHDLGKWMFALTVFWAYIAFSQYLLIWYANMPEETVFFQMRFQGTWAAVSLLLLFGHFVLPFLLLPQGNKRSFTILKIAAVWILFIQAVDHYWLVMPNFTAHHGEATNNVHLHWLDFTCLTAVASTYAFAFWSRLKNRSLICTGDPRLQQALEFTNV